jgi:molecular chaperone DnaK
LDGTAEVKDIPLSRKGDNRIKVSVLDSRGNVLSGASREICIVRTEASADGMPMTHTLAVKIAAGAIGAERNVLMTLVKKGTPVPKTGVEHFRAARDLRAGDGKYLDFELYEQAEGVDDPDLNLCIGEFRLGADELSRGDVIRRGDDVFVHWEIDANGLLDCRLEFPSLSRTYNTGKMYVSTAGHKNFAGDEGRALAGSILQIADNDILKLEQALGSNVAGEASELKKRIDRQFENLKLSIDPETRRSITEEARQCRQEVHRIANRPENVRASLRAEIDGLTESFSADLNGILDQKIQQQLHRLAGIARDALAREGARAVEDARASIKEIRSIVITELAKHPDFWVARFESLQHVPTAMNRDSQDTPEVRV